MKQKQAEVLAPAGSFDSLQAAINAGADSIYFGVEQLNMRTRSAGTFTIEDIKEISSICKANGLKSYITVFSVIYDFRPFALQMLLLSLMSSIVNVPAARVRIFDCSTPK